MNSRIQESKILPKLTAHSGTATVQFGCFLFSKISQDPQILPALSRIAGDRSMRFSFNGLDMQFRYRPLSGRLTCSWQGRLVATSGLNPFGGAFAV